MAEQERRVYDFTIPLRLPTVNKLLRMHWNVRRKLANRWAWEVRAAATPPPTPLQRCAIIIERESTQEPDPDGLKNTAKILLDVLQPCSTRHPLGLGFIAEDNSGCILELVVRHVAGNGERTRVVIREVV